MTFSISAEHAAAHLAATVAFADAGADASKIRLYSGADGTGTMLAEAALAKPCATLAGGMLTLHVADAAGAMVLASGIPRSMRWVSGAGLTVAIGTVTDFDHDGDVRLIGSGTAEGETSPNLYAGGLVALPEITFA